MFIFWKNKTTDRKSIYRIILCINCRVKENYKQEILIKIVFKKTQYTDFHDNPARRKIHT